MAQKTAAQEAFDNVIRNHVAPPLKSGGLIKSGLNWRLHGTLGIGLINVQKSRWGNRDDISFTVNLGVRFDAVHRADYPRAQWMWNKQPTVMSCHTQRRIGRLMPANMDVWWEVNAHSDADALGAEVSDAIVQFGLPWVKMALSDTALLASLLATWGVNDLSPRESAGGDQH